MINEKLKFLFENFKPVDSIIVEEEYISTIQVLQTKIPIDFSIPMAKAGPIHVPSINYNEYQINSL